MAHSRSSNQMVLVDGDACPVKSEIAEAARTAGVPVIMVSSYNHELQGEEGVEIVRVDSGDQSADLYIANRMKPGDLVLTNDYGLAALALGKKCLCLSFRGIVYGDDNMDMMLEGRHARAKERRSGRYGKGPKPLTAGEKLFFQHKLTNLLSRLQENVQP
ncbi:YaiI/YqxD family protein [Paenibacillus glufosinatiresistens]|uniref:YaiI/YqxD family protein n=1 Tax=Paenibacillus glufosinatiresistens TaxID=3070657 RepID=UPI00286E5AE9|nr:DUF188 domain-containing protein [Paenibacillus sp. YX.27]